ELVGIEQPGLQKRQAAVELDSIYREEIRRQGEICKGRDREKSLIGEVVYREDARHRRGGRSQIGRRQPGVPIMGVQDIRSPLRGGALRQRRGGPTEQREAAEIVGPGAAGEIRVRAARTAVESG